MRSFVYTPEELIKALIRMNDITSGHWELALGFDIKAAQVSDQPDHPPLPSVMFRVGQIGIAEQANPTPGTVDASLLRGSRNDSD